MKKPIPLHIAMDCAKHNTVCVWLQLRALYRHPVIYRFNYANLSKQTGISHTSLRKHVKLMIEYGWAVITEQGHLKLHGIDRLKENSPLVLVPVRATKKDQILELRNIVITHNLHQQERQIKRKSKTVKNANTDFGKLSKGELKAIQKAGGLEKFNSRFTNYCTLSNYRFGLLINRSKWTGYRLQKQLRDQKLITTTTKLTKYMEGVSKQCFKMMQLHNYIPGLIHNQQTGVVYKRGSNRVDAKVYRQEV